MWQGTTEIKHFYYNHRADRSTIQRGRLHMHAYTQLSNAGGGGCATQRHTFHLHRQSSCQSSLIEMIGLHSCDIFITKGGRFLMENKQGVWGGGCFDKTTFWCLKCTQENCPCVQGIKHKTADSLNTSVSPQCWFSETHQMVTFFLSFFF